MAFSLRTVPKSSRFILIQVAKPDLSLARAADYLALSHFKKKKKIKIFKWLWSWVLDDFT